MKKNCDVLFSNSPKSHIYYIMAKSPYYQSSYLWIKIKENAFVSSFSIKMKDNK